MSEWEGEKRREEGTRETNTEEGIRGKDEERVCHKNINIRL